MKLFKLSLLLILFSNALYALSPAPPTSTFDTVRGSLIVLNIFHHARPNPTHVTPRPFSRAIAEIKGNYLHSTNSQKTIFLIKSKAANIQLKNCKQGEYVLSRDGQIFRGPNRIPTATYRLVGSQCFDQPDNPTQIEGIGSLTLVGAIPFGTGTTDDGRPVAIEPVPATNDSQPGMIAPPSIPHVYPYEPVLAFIKTVLPTGLPGISREYTISQNASGVELINCKKGKFKIEAINNSTFRPHYYAIRYKLLSYNCQDQKDYDPNVISINEIPEGSTGFSLIENAKVVRIQTVSGPNGVCPEHITSCAQAEEVTIQFSLKGCADKLGPVSYELKSIMDKLYIFLTAWNIHNEASNNRMCYSRPSGYRKILVAPHLLNSARDNIELQLITQNAQKIDY